jgi:hypothetical protein
MGVCRREIKKIRAFSSCGIALGNAFLCALFIDG